MLRAIIVGRWYEGLARWQARAERDGEVEEMALVRHALDLPDFPW